MTKQHYEHAKQAYQVHVFEKSGSPENIFDRYPNVFAQYPSWFVENTGIQEAAPAVPQLKKQKQRPSKSLFPNLYSTLASGLNN